MIATNRILAMLVLSALLGCSSSQPVAPLPTVIVTREAPPPGTVEYAWEEPMVDVVDVPPGLDPEGHYYRPAHQEIIQVRQGRWKHYRFPEGK